MNKYEIVTHSMVRNAYKTGVARLIPSPHEDGVVCKIGDNWFYFFGGVDNENISVEDFVQKVPEDEIVKRIYDAICEIKTDVDKDEYNYYLSIFEENRL